MWYSPPFPKYGTFKVKAIVDIRTETRPVLKQEKSVTTIKILINMTGELEVEVGINTS